MHSLNPKDWFISCKDVDLYFIPYLPFSSLDTSLTFNLKTKYTICFGHWDLTDFSKLSGTISLHSNGIPTGVLLYSDLIVSGHEHLPKVDKLVNNSIECIVTGSMQPYAHGEQLKDEFLYLTHTLVEILDNLSKNKDYYLESNVRVILDLEDIPPSFTCLSINYLYKAVQVVTKEVEEIVEESTTSETTPLAFSTMLYERLGDESEPLLNKYLQDCFMNKTYEQWSYNV